MDAVSKRQLVLAVFLAVQSWKLYEWAFELLPAGFEYLDLLLAFLFKWATIELMLIGVVQYFRVPKMTWSLPTRAFLFGLLVCFNVGLIVVGPMIGVWFAPRRTETDASSILKSGLVDDIAGSKDIFTKGCIHDQSIVYSPSRVFESYWRGVHGKGAPMGPSQAEPGPGAPLRAHLDTAAEQPGAAREQPAPRARGHTACCTFAIALEWGGPVDSHLGVCGQSAFLQPGAPED
jgi:hypothetical protein